MAVGDELLGLAAVQALIARLQVDVLVLIAAVGVVVVVALIDRRVNATQVVDRLLEAADVATITWLIERPVTCLIVSTRYVVPNVYAAFSRVGPISPFGVSIGTHNSLGIDIIEMYGLLGSIRTSSISFARWGTAFG